MRIQLSAVFVLAVLIFIPNSSLAFDQKILFCYETGRHASDTPGDILIEVTIFFIDPSFLKNAYRIILIKHFSGRSTPVPCRAYGTEWPRKYDRLRLIRRCPGQQRCGQL